MRILVAPYSAKLPNGNTNPKNYPYWPEFVTMLNKEGYMVVQIGVTGEQRIAGTSEFFENPSFATVKELVGCCATWVSVDSWLPHFCHAENLKHGVVIFGQSDPRIFGYPENINLLRGRENLRQFQYDSWMAVEYSPQVFVYPDRVIEAVRKLAPNPSVPPEMLLTADLHGTRVTSS